MSKLQCAVVNLKDIHQLENSRCDEFDYAELMASIKESGLVQPIVVAKNFSKRSKLPWVLVAGNRRYKALQKLGMKTTNVVVNDKVKSEADLLILNGIENLQREDITAYEQGRIIEKLTVKHGLSQKEVAVRLGMAPIKVGAILKAYHQTPARFRDKVVLNAAASRGKAGTVSMSAAMSILNANKDGLINKTQVNRLMKDVSANVYTNEHIKTMVRDLREGHRLEDIIAGSKKLTYISVKLPITTKERDKLLDANDCTLQQLVEKVVYGETPVRFTRPKVGAVKGKSRTVTPQRHRRRRSS